MNNNIKITEASVGNAEDIANIQTEAWNCAYPNSELGITKQDIKAKTDEFNKQGTNRIKGEILRAGARTWVARKNGKAVGFIGALKEEGEYKIMALHILPEFQGQGIGSELLKTALNWLGNSEKITIEVVSYNNKAINFYEKFGFTNTAKIVEDKIQLLGDKFIEKILMEKV